MSAPVSRVAIVAALLKKELKAYARDKIFLALTLAVLILMPIAFTFLPETVDEDITLAVSPPLQTLLGDAREQMLALGATEEQLAELDQTDLTESEEGLLFVEFEDEEQLQAVVDGSLEAWMTDGGELVLRDTEADEDKPEDAEKLSVDIGIAFPEGFIGDVVAGRDDVRVTVHAAADVPEEIRDAMEGFVREAAYQLAGRDLPVEMVDEDELVLGTDRVGDQVSIKDKFRPLLIFMILLMETFSMASLVSVEVLQRTVTAVLVTPAKVGDFLFAKTVFGTLMSLGQALIVLAFVGGLTAENWSLVAAVLLMGAMMFTGVALFVGAAGRDFMGQLFYTMLLTVPLLLPSFSVLFPGTAATWIRVIPTYPIIDTLVGAFNYGATWSDAGTSLAFAAAWLVVIFGAGMFALKRKVESL